MPSISIALATFNGEEFLESQLRSLAAQTTLPIELVVVDDGSLDSTTSIVRDFAKTAVFPVRLYDNRPRLGYRANFMRAAGWCGGDLIAFCDQDDVWEPEKLAVMALQFDDPGVLLAYHNATVTTAAGVRVGELYDSLRSRTTLPPLTENPWRLVKGFTQVFRRSLLRYSALHAASVDPYWPEECLAHDQWFLFLASVLGDTVRVPQSLARYRQHADNEHGWTPQSHLEPRPHFLLSTPFIAAAQNRMELLRRLSGQTGPECQAAIDAAIAYYEQLRQRLSERGSIYQSKSIAERAGAVHTLLQQGAYQSRQGAPGFGWTGLLMDICLGVTLGPRAKSRL